MAKNVSECIAKRDFVLDKISFDGNDYFKFVGNAELTVMDSLESKSYSDKEFIISIGRTISAETEKLFTLSVFYDVHFILKEDSDKLTEEEVDLYVKENYQEFASICMAKISLLISQITSQLGSGVPIISSPYFSKDDEITTE